MNINERRRKKFESTSVRENLDLNFSSSFPWSLFGPMPHHTHESSPKKRKAQDQAPSSSKILKKKSKILPNSNIDSEGEFHVVKASLRLSVPPIFANNPRAGIEEMLDSMIMRCILLSYIVPCPIE